MSSSGSGSTVTQTTQPNPEVMAAYNSLVTGAGNISQQPLSLYQGPLIAGFTPQQQAGFATIDAAQGVGYPYLNAAAQEFGSATTPLWPTLPQFDTTYLPTTAQGYWDTGQGYIGQAGTYGSQGAGYAAQTPTYQSGATSYGGIGAGYGGQGATMAAQTPTYTGYAMGTAGQTPLYTGTAMGFSGATPYYQSSATAPINIDPYSTLSTYFNPYQEEVTNALEQQFALQNQQQYEQIAGNATQQNAYGGDREVVAESLAAQAQNMAQAPVLAQVQQQGFAQAQQELNTQQQLQLQQQQAERQLALGAGQLGLGAGNLALGAGQENLGAAQVGLGAGQLNLGAANTTISAASPYMQAGQMQLGAGQLGLGASNAMYGAGQLSLGMGGQELGYGQAGFGEFNTQQQQQLAAEQANAWLASQAGFGLASLGTQAQQQALTGAQAELMAGGMQQQLAQEQLNIPYQQFQMTQAYPYQQMAFLSPIVEGTGSLTGGTGSTTYPGPSMASQIGGIGLAGAGLYGMGSQQGWWGTPTYSSYDAGVWNGWGEPGMWKRGGRTGYAMGGGIGDTPTVPGIGKGVPVEDLSWIPTQAPGGHPSSMGMGIGGMGAQTSSTSSGGASNPIGDIVGAAGAAKTAVDVGSWLGGLFLLKDGGRAGYADGGSVSLTPLPEVPTLSLDYIVHPGPAIKGKGPPSAPPAPASATQPHGIGDDAMKLMAGAKDLKNLGLFGSSSSGEESMGGRVGYADGGIPLGAAISFGGANPGTSGSYQQLMQMPLERLREMAVQFPPTTQQGRLISQAIAAKQATVGGGTATPTQQQSNMADGGDTGPDTRGYVTEDELDPHPVVDHSGKSVVVRYKSEGKTLDLGLPPIKRPDFDAGGSTGPTRQEESTTPGLGGEAFMADNGVWIPQLTTTASPFGQQITPSVTWNGIGGGPTMQPGGGMGNWFQPLATPYAAVGAGPTGPNGSMMFPQAIAYTPQMQAITSAIRPGSVAPPEFGGPVGGAAPAVPTTTVGTPSSSADQLAGALGVDPSMFSSDMTQGGKRGGRFRFDDGGDVPDDDSGLGGASISDRDLASANIDAILSKYRNRDDTAPPSGGVQDNKADAQEAPSPATDLSLVELAKPPRTSDHGIGEDTVDVHRALNDPEYRKAIIPDIQSPGARPAPATAPSTFGAEPKIVDTSLARSTGEAIGGFLQGTPEAEAINRGVPVEQVIHERNARAARDVSETIANPATVLPLAQPQGGLGFGSVEPPEGLGGGIGQPAKVAAPAPTSTPPAPVIPETKPVTPSPAPPKIEQPKLATRPVPQPSTRPAAAPSQWTAVGDSIGVGYIRNGGLSGSAVALKNQPGAADADAAGGRTPKEVLDFITAHPERFRGKPVMLSTGVSNDPSQIALVPDQIKALQDAGATQIQVAGVGNKAGTEAGKTFDLRQYNPVLEQYATSAGARFGGPLPAVVHPAPDYYRGSAQMLEAHPEGRAEPIPTTTGQAKATQIPTNYGPVASALVSEAHRQGLPDSLVLKAAQIESGMGTNLGTRGNVLQLGQREWQEIGGGDMRDLATQAKNGVAWLAKSRNEAQQALGREPQDWETYIVHQQGSVGGTALLKANPNASAVDVLTPAYGGNRQAAMAAITHNGGDLGMTAGQFMAMTRDRFEGFGKRLNTGAQLAQGKGGDQLVGPGTGKPGLEAQPTAQPTPAQADQIKRAILERTEPEHRSAMKRWMDSPYFMLFMMGAGMLASRSPYPGVALGEGMQLAGKSMMQMRAEQNKEDLAESRAQRVADQAQSAYDKLALSRELGTSKAAAQAQHWEDQHQKWQADIATNIVKLQQAQSEHERKVLADQLRHDAQMAIATKPSAPLAMAQAWMAEKGGSIDDALRGIRAAQADPNARANLELKLQAEARNRAKLEETAFTMNLQNAGRTFDVQGSYQRNLDELRAQMNAFGTAPQQPAQQPAQPAPQPAGDHPPVIQNGYRYEWKDGQYQPVGAAQ